MYINYSVKSHKDTNLWRRWILMNWNRGRTIFLYLNWRQYAYGRGRRSHMDHLIAFGCQCVFYYNIACNRDRTLMLDVINE